MASELNMYQAQVNEYKYEVERLTRDVQDMKRKYYQQKRKEQLLKGDDDDDNGEGYKKEKMSKSGPMNQIHNEQIIAAKNSRVRYTGGGFAIKDPKAM